MPTYEYICSKCGHTFEKVQSMSDATLTVCPKDLCPKKSWGKGKVKRAITAGAGLIFKGTGFYITDYRSDKYKAAAQKDTAASSGSTSSTSAASSSKPSSTPATPNTPSTPSAPAAKSKT